MQVSLVIPALNEADGIVVAVRRAWEAGADEGIVVDGGSSDRTADIAADQQCVVVRSRPGRGVQQNAGASRASGDVLVFQHADNWLAPDTIRQVRTACRESRVVGGSFRQRIEAAGVAFRLLEWGNGFRARWLGLPFGDQNLFVRRDVFEQLGGFPDVPLMEDVLLAKLLRRQGAMVVLPGPLHVSPRRWRRYGVVRQTFRNWCLLTALHCGVSPTRLARYYPRH